MAQTAEAKINTSAKTPTYRLATVTPDLAREWLKRNTHNRRLDEKRTYTFAEAMKRGEWSENGDAIRFSKTGVLLDGQKRLQAVLKSGVTIRALVVENLPDEAQITMDIGQTRNFAQTLQLEGIGDPNNLAALTRWVYRWETGQIRSQNRPPTFAQLLSLVHTRFDDLRASSNAGAKVRRHVPIRRTIISLAHWAFVQIDKEDAEAFFERLAHGSGLAPGDPILVLREAFLRDAAMHGKNRMTDTFALAITIKAWNAYRAGERVQLLRWRAGGVQAEEFPEPK